jgi:hypothetical protein
MFRVEVKARGRHKVGSDRPAKLGNAVGHIRITPFPKLDLNLLVSFIPPYPCVLGDGALDVFGSIFGLLGLYLD